MFVFVFVFVFLFLFLSVPAFSFAFPISVCPKVAVLVTIAGAVFASVLPVAFVGSCDIPIGPFHNGSVPSLSLSFSFANSLFILLN